MIEMTIQEGSCYVEGQVQVTGVATDLQQYIVTKLCKPTAERDLHRRDDGREDACHFELSDFDDARHDPQPPWWVEGEAVPFHDTAIRQFRERISSILWDCGHDRAQFDVSLQRSESRADLVIRVDDLGPPMIIRSVRVLGNGKNSEQEIIEYADVRPGTLLTPTEYKRIGRRLWQSARFITQKLEVAPAADGVDLMIVVREYPAAPRLSEPLSREESTLLKLREWFVSGDGGKEDLVLQSFSTEDKRCLLTSVLSPHSGIIITVTDPRVSQTDDEWTYGFLLCDRRVSLCSRIARTRVDLDIGGLRIKPQIAIAAKKESYAEPPWETSLSLSISPVTRGDTKPPLTTTLRFEPTGFLAMAHRAGVSTEWDKDVLILRTPQSRTKISGKSGQLIESIMFSDDENAPDTRLTTSRGAFETLLVRYEQEVADCQQVFRPQQPISSVAAFVLSNRPPDQTIAGFDPAKYLLRQEHRDVLLKLIDRGALQLADDLTNEAISSLDRRFHIPLEPQFTSLPIWQRGVGLADTLFPYGTWPWNVWRGAWMLLSGANEPVTDMYREIYVSDDGRPLAWWVISRLFGLFSPEHAVDAAARGLKSVDGKAFLADCDALLDTRYAVGRSIHSLVRNVAELSESETLTLGQLLTEANLVTGPQVIPEFMATYRKNLISDDPLRETLLQYWDGGLGARLVEDMRSRKRRVVHSKETRPTTPPTRDAPAIKGWEASRLMSLPEVKASGK